ncbi:MAG: hypothetical protein DMF72_11260 [Acidobacteria bacterium]|nr:MAG: hypothetical protein DMF72_11260 [Acidobacteriota bacterium]
MPKRSAARAILTGGLIAGTLDITYACVFFGIRNHVSPIRILQSVARGALGQNAFQGGLKSAALGLFFHFLIALIAATVYFLLSRALRFMVTYAILSGILYGACVYFFMYGIVMRVSAIHSTTLPWSYPWQVLIPNLLIHIFGIGLPIALAVRRYSK